MITIQKKVVVDDQGNPTDVIIPWEQYREVEEILGIDLDDQAREDLRQAKKDRVNSNLDAFIEIDSV